MKYINIIITENKPILISWYCLKYYTHICHNYTAITGFLSLSLTGELQLSATKSHHVAKHFRDQFGQYTHNVWHYHDYSGLEWMWLFFKDMWLFVFHSSLHRLYMYTHTCTDNISCLHILYIYLCCNFSNSHFPSLGSSSQTTNGSRSAPSKSKAKSNKDEVSVLPVCTIQSSLEQGMDILCCINSTYVSYISQSLNIGGNRKLLKHTKHVSIF